MTDYVSPLELPWPELKRRVAAHAAAGDTRAHKVLEDLLACEHRRDPAEETFARLMCMPYVT